MKLLVVEDEPRMLELLRRGLTEEGHNVTCASDGREGWELAHAYEFDAVVLDIMLPGKDGFSVVSELRAARNYVPVLMLTARGRPEDVLKGFASGADDFDLDGATRRCGIVASEGELSPAVQAW